MTTPRLPGTAENGYSLVLRQQIHLENACFTSLSSLRLTVPAFGLAVGINLPRRDTNLLEVHRHGGGLLGPPATADLLSAMAVILPDRRRVLECLS